MRALVAILAVGPFLTVAGLLLDGVARQRWAGWLAFVGFAMTLVLILVARLGGIASLRRKYEED